MKGQPRNTGRTVSEAEFRRMWADLSVSVEDIGRRRHFRQRGEDARQAPGPAGSPARQAVCRRHDHDRMVRLYRARLSMAAVAQAVGCREHTVLQALRRAGEPSRDRHDRSPPGACCRPSWPPARGKPRPP